LLGDRENVLSDKRFSTCQKDDGNPQMLGFSDDFAYSGNRELFPGILVQMLGITALAIQVALLCDAENQKGRHMYPLLLVFQSYTCRTALPKKMLCHGDKITRLSSYDSESVREKEMEPSIERSCKL
jgi:hypothetical protein